MLMNGHSAQSVMCWREKKQQHEARLGLLAQTSTRELTAYNVAKTRPGVQDTTLGGCCMTSNLNTNKNIGAATLWCF